MKQLEHVRVVQFYLSEAEDLHIDEITGIFGPNGAGKSSWLDAIQIAMMGANSNAMAFNAQADDKTKRSIRSYCLGQYGEGERRARERSTTYITLIWRDTETGIPISTGICIYASADEEKHTVLGRYVAPGVDISLGDHLETVDGIEGPKDWKSFRMVLAQRSENITGERDIFFEDGKPYVNGLLTALRGSRGVPPIEAFTRAFRFALRMRFDKSVDHIIRHDILECRPTKTGRFREITESFRKLNETVMNVAAKINAGRNVADAYVSVATKTRTLTTWRALATRIEQAEGNELYKASIEKQKTSKQILLDVERTLEQASQRVKNLAAKLLEKRGLMVAHSAHKNVEQAQHDREVAELRISERNIEAAKILLEAVSVMRKAANKPALKSFALQLNDAAAKIDASARGQSLSVSAAMEACTSMREITHTVANHLLNGPMQESAQKLLEIDNSLEDIATAIGRVSEGKANLSQTVQGLLSEFSRNNLSPVPVCDVVRVTNSAWQAVIEGYLGHNTEALLVVEAAEEEPAFRLYREIDARRNIFGVKVVRASQQKINDRPRPGSVAELIEGTHPAAVAYLRRQFGDLKCAERDDEALAGETLTCDGMLVRRGAFERIKLIPAEQQKLGISVPGRLQQLKRTQQELEEKKGAISEEVNQWRQLYQELAALAGNEKTKRIEATLEMAAEANADLNTAMIRISEVADDEYLCLCDEVAALDLQLPEIRGAEGNAREAKGKAEAECLTANTAVSIAQNNLDVINERMKVAESDSDYDSSFATEQWERLLSRFADRYGEMAGFAGRRIDEGTKERDAALTKASNSFGEYLATYHDTPAEEVRDDWRQAAIWINTEVERLERTDLQNYREQADEAYRSAQETFRTDVANRLYENFSLLESQLKRLKQTLDSCPTFSNGERYRFKANLREQYKKLDRFIRDVAAYGPENDLLGGPGEVPEEFQALMNDRALAGAASVPNLLDDYREFYDFDIEIRREDPITRESILVGRLSERLGAASGGEYRAPLYVIAGAALASAYRMDDGQHDGVRLILLDEAFDKMDTNNLVATMRYLEDLGLQVLLASPGENKGALDAFLYRYYDVLRDPSSNSVRFEGHDVSVETRVAMRADLPEFHPELIDEELAAMVQEQVRA